MTMRLRQMLEPPLDPPTHTVCPDCYWEEYGEDVPKDYDDTPIELCKSHQMLARADIEESERREVDL